MRNITSSLHFAGVAQASRPWKLLPLVLVNRHVRLASFAEAWARTHKLRLFLCGDQQGWMVVTQVAIHLLTWPNIPVRGVGDGHPSIGPRVVVFYFFFGGGFPY